MFDRANKIMKFFVLVLVAGCQSVSTLSPDEISRPVSTNESMAFPTSIAIPTSSPSESPLPINETCDETVPINADQLWDLAISPSGEYFAAALDSGIYVYLTQNLQGVWSYPYYDVDYGGVKTVAFSPDSRILASASESGEVILWEVDKGEAISSFLVPGDSEVYFSDDIGNLAFSPDGKLLAVRECNTLILWDIEQNKILDIIDTFHACLSSTGIAFSPDSQMVAFSDTDSWIHLWNISERKQGPRFPLPDQLDSSSYLTATGGLDISPDGQLLAVGAYNGYIALWDIRTMDPIDFIPGYDWGDLAFSPDHERLAFINQEGTINLWDMNKSELIRTFGCDNPENYIVSLAFFPDGKALAAGTSAGFITLWNTQNGERLELIRKGSYKFTSADMAFTPQASDDPEPYPILPEPLLIERQNIHFRSYAIDQLAFLPDGETQVLTDVLGASVVQAGAPKPMWNWSNQSSDNFSVISYDGSTIGFYNGKNIQVWDTTSKNQIQMLELPNRISTITLSFNGKTLAAGTNDVAITIWDVASGGVIKELGKEHLGNIDIEKIAFNHDGTLIAGGHSNQLFIWNLESDEIFYPPTGCKTGGVSAMAFSPNGKHLVYACGVKGTNQGEVAVLETSQWAIEALFYIHAIHNVAFSHNSAIVALGSDDEIYLFDTRRGYYDTWLLYYLLRLDIAYDTNYEDATSIAFSPKGNLIAAGTNAGTISIWELPQPPISETKDVACLLLPGQTVRLLENANYWSEPDASTGISSPASAGTIVYAIEGPQWGKITVSGTSSGWFWKVGFSEDGPGLGWVWENVMEECQ